jgi:manganese-dependent inorganic pyrophosphatase
MTPEQAIAADSKLYEKDDHEFTVAQIEELTFVHFPEKRDGLLAALEQHRSKQGLLFAALLVTDINAQDSLLLVRGAEAFLQTIDYPLESPLVWDLEGVVSRKKQLLPFLLQCVEKMRLSAD